MLLNSEWIALALYVLGLFPVYAVWVCYRGKSLTVRASWLRVFLTLIWPLLTLATLIVIAATFWRKDETLD